MRTVGMTSLYTILENLKIDSSENRDVRSKCTKHVMGSGRKVYNNFQNESLSAEKRKEKLEPGNLKSKPNCSKDNIKIAKMTKLSTKRMQRLKIDKKESRLKKSKKS